MDLKVLELAPHKAGLAQTRANLIDGDFIYEAVPSLLDAPKLLRELFDPRLCFSLRPKPKGKHSLLAAKFPYDGKYRGPGERYLSFVEDSAST